jgi:hypothetical protein
MRRVLLVLVALLLALFTITNFPALPSPTPMPTIQITVLPTGGPTATPGPTNTPAPTGTLFADFSNVGDQLETLAAVVNATSIPVEVNGTPVDPGSELEGMTGDAGTFFGYLRGFSEVNLGGFTPWVGLLILGFVLLVSMKSLGFILPVAAVIFRLILRIVEVVKQVIGL